MLIRLKEEFCKHCVKFLDPLTYIRKTVFFVVPKRVEGETLHRM